jgi:uncharacterized protein YqgQ
VKTPGLMCRLCATECIRVYSDRLIDRADYQKAKAVCIIAANKNFDTFTDIQ